MEGSAMDFSLASGTGFVGTAALAVAFVFTSRSPSVSMRRAAAILGVLAIVPLILLGAAWPSAFTLAALVALPAAVLLLAGIGRPSVLLGAKTRLYSLVAVFLSPACWLAETFFLHQ